MKTKPKTTESNEEIEVKPDDGYVKPGYDGRMQYYATLEKFMLGLSNAQIAGDFAAWIRVASGFISLIGPYIKPSHAVILREKLNQARAGYMKLQQNMYESSNKAYVEGILDTQLQQLTDKIYEFGRHIFLPVSDEESEEFDIEQFFKESDL